MQIFIKRDHRGKLLEKSYGRRRRFESLYD